MRSQAWPGATSIKALMRGEELEGTWIDRTAQFKAYERNQPNPDALFTARHRLKLSPLPCWEDLGESACQSKVRRMVREIERATEGASVLGRQAILRQDPHARPKSTAARSPAPRFHAIEPQVRRALEWGYRTIQAAYRQATEDMRLGRTANFPGGCFKPPGVFVALQV